MVLVLSPLGDTLFTTPAIRALSEQFPRARILVLASRPAAGILKSNPYGMEVIALSDQWDFLKKLTLARKAKYDLALGLSQLGSFFTRFCGASCHWDFNDIDCRRPQSVVQKCLEIVRCAGCKPSSLHTEFWLGEGEEAAAARTVAQFLGQAKKRDGCLVAVHCGGHYFVRKRWPVANFIELIQRLQGENGYRVVLVGGREDRENSLLIQDAVPKVLNAVGVFELAETAVLLKNCRLFIGNDSGPLHLAAAVKTPTLGLFGPTPPSQFYPYHPPLHRFIRKALPCSPCYKFGGVFWQQIPKCSRAYCMEAITPAEVIKEIELNFYQEKLPV